MSKKLTGKQRRSKAIKLLKRFGNAGWQQFQIALAADIRADTISSWWGNSTPNTASLDRLECAAELWLDEIGNDWTPTKLLVQILNTKSFNKASRVLNLKL